VFDSVILYAVVLNNLFISSSIFAYIGFSYAVCTALIINYIKFSMKNCSSTILEELPLLIIIIPYNCAICLAKLFNFFLSYLSIDIHGTFLCVDSDSKFL
jgi:hypothetical protein